MHLYTSGTPSDDHCQVLENQMCSHRLFSMHGDYQGGVMKWLDLVRSGARTFEDNCAGKRDFLLLLEHRDEVMRQTLREQGVVEPWVPYAEALRLVSTRFPETYPRYIMLDSGAFTAWNVGRQVTLDEVKKVYGAFLKKAEGLFDEIWLVNLDVITDKKATTQQLRAAVDGSDKNLIALRAEFGNNVLPVFHQGEGNTRFLEVIDQAKGYLCLSPNNKLPEEERWRWAKLARNALSYLDCNVKTHGLATTGNEMIRNVSLYSGDSAAWTLHSAFGVVDLIHDEAIHAEVLSTRGVIGKEPVTDTGILEIKRNRYQAYHIARDRNDYDHKAKVDLLDNKRHQTNLPREEQTWVRARVEAHMPFLLAQFDVGARALINIAELQSYAESIPWQLPGPHIKVGGLPVEKDSPFYHELRPYPLSEARARFMADEGFSHL